jgi:hypothetical protein
VNHVAFLTTAGWSACGDGTNGPVSALEVFEDASDTLHSGPQLIVGGSFTAASGILARNIARWHGNTWSTIDGTVDSGTSGPVLALQSALVSGTTNHRLYIGGAFSSTGTMSAPFMANNIVSWRASGGWKDLSTAGVNGTDGPVRALIPSTEGSHLYAGGDFDSAAALENTPRVAAWDGVVWQGLLLGLDNRVSAFAVGPNGSINAIYAGGRFQRTGDSKATRRPVPTKMIAMWTGSAWSPVGTPETQLAPPVMVEEQMVRRMAERVFACPNAGPTFQPRITRGHLRGPDVLEIVDPVRPWQIEVHVPDTDLPIAARGNSSTWESYTVFFAISDDRDFRRSDNRSYQGGPVHAYLSPLTANVGQRQQESFDRYSPIRGEEGAVGSNRIFEGNGNADRASVYFDTRPTEDFFFEIEPTSIAVAGDVRTITFDPPQELGAFIDTLPVPVGVPIVAVIVRLRVGLPDDGNHDDVAFTEVAFRNDGMYGHYESLPTSPSPAPVVLAVSPRIGWGAGDTRADAGGAYSGDVVLIHGTGFFLTDATNPAPDIRFGTQQAPAASVRVINSRTIQCRVPTADGQIPQTVSVSIVWGPYGTSSLSNGFTYH